MSNLSALSKDKTIAKSRASLRKKTSPAKLITAIHDNAMAIIETVLNKEMNREQAHLSRLVLEGNIGGLVTCKGPHGCGKSTALIVHAAALLDDKVLCTAHTNVAADSLCLAIQDTIPVYRKYINDRLPGDGNKDADKSKHCRQFSPCNERDIAKDLMASDAAPTETTNDQLGLITTTEAPLVNAVNRRCEQHSASVAINEGARIKSIAPRWSKWRIYIDAAAKLRGANPARRRSMVSVHSMRSSERSS